MHYQARTLAVLAALAATGCAAPPPAPAVVTTSSVNDPSGLLASAQPAPGSTVAGPVNQLVLVFREPVALGEILVSGPDGLMPMMVGSAGLQTRFVIPLPGLTSGDYRARWRVQWRGAEHSGDFAFRVS